MLGAALSAPPPWAPLCSPPAGIGGCERWGTAAYCCAVLWVRERRLAAVQDRRVRLEAQRRADQVEGVVRCRRASGIDGYVLLFHYF